MACMRAAYRTVLFLYSVTDENLCVNVAISDGGGGGGVGIDGGGGT